MSDYECFFARREDAGPCSGSLIRKLCECGCGEPAPIARSNNPAKGYVKGQPTRFVHGHNSRGQPSPHKGIVKRVPILRTCQQCGERFDALSNSPTRKFCSQACYTKAQRKDVECVCEGCGTRFRAKASAVKNGGGRYCNRACWRAHMVSPALLPGVADKISAARTKTGKGTGKRRRQAEHAGMTLAGKGEMFCRNCGSNEYLNLHHAIPRSMWKAGILEPLNGIPLCVRCHMGWHHQYVTIYRDVFTPDEWACISSADLLGQNVQAWLDRRYPRRGEG